MTSGLAARFVSETTLPLVRSVAAAMPSLRWSVVTHADLEEDLWFSFYRGKKLPPVDEAQALAGRPLTDAQLRHVIAVDSRAKVLLALVEQNILTAGQLTLLTAAKGCTAPVVDRLLDRQPETLSHEWLREAGLKAGGRVMLAYLCQAEELSDAEIGEQLLRYDDWGPKKNYADRQWAKQQLLQLLHARPGLVTFAVDSGDRDLASLVAGTRLIADVELQYRIAGLREPEAAEPTAAWCNDRVWTWIALVWNPVAALEVVQALDPLLHRQTEKADAAYAAEDRIKRKPAPVTVAFDEVESADQLTWLIQRTLSKPRPEDFGILVRNPHLGPGEAEKLLMAPLTGDHRTSFVALAAPGSPVEADLLALAARHPDVAGEHYAEQLAAAWRRWNGTDDAARDERPGQDGPARTPDEDRIAATGGHHISVVGHNTLARLRLEREVTPSREAWQFVLTQLDEFGGTVDDLALVANSVSAAA